MRLRLLVAAVATALTLALPAGALADGGISWAAKEYLGITPMSID